MEDNFNDFPPFLPLGQDQFPAKDFIGTSVENKWTPTISFATPGDLSIIYLNQAGSSLVIGTWVIAPFFVSTAIGGFTHSTASGNLQIGGLPYLSKNETLQRPGMGLQRWQGITKAGFTDAGTLVNPNSRVALVIMSGSGQDPLTITAADMPSGGNVAFVGILIYERAGP